MTHHPPPPYRDPSADSAGAHLLRIVLWGLLAVVLMVLAAATG